MAEEALVESLINESGELVKALDSQGDEPTNVLWYYFSESGEWRLLVAGPTFDSLLPEEQGQAYQRIAKAIRSAKLETLTIADVKVVKTNEPVLEATKFVLKTPQSAVIRAHFRNNTFNGIFVKEMLVLRAA